MVVPRVHAGFGLSTCEALALVIGTTSLLWNVYHSWSTRRREQPKLHVTLRVVHGRVTVAHRPVDELAERDAHPTDTALIPVVDLPDDALIGVTAENVGTPPVIVRRWGLRLPSRKLLPLPWSDTIEESASFTDLRGATIPPGQAMVPEYHLGAVRLEQKRRGYSGRVQVRGLCQDHRRKTFVSRPLILDLDPSPPAPPAAR